MYWAAKEIWHKNANSFLGPISLFILLHLLAKIFTCFAGQTAEPYLNFFCQIL